MNITVVEISSQIARTASKWFDLRLDAYQSLVIMDGTKFVEEQVKKGWEPMQQLRIEWGHFPSCADKLGKICEALLACGQNDDAAALPCLVAPHIKQGGIPE